MAKIFVGARVAPDLVEKLDRLATDTGKDRTRLLVEAIALLVGADIEPTGDRLDRMQGQIDAMEGRVGELLARLSSLGKPQGKSPIRMPVTATPVKRWA